jgi:hypothetical protein
LSTWRCKSIGKKKKKKKKKRHEAGENYMTNFMLSNYSQRLTGDKIVDEITGA